MLFAIARARSCCKMPLVFDSQIFIAGSFAKPSFGSLHVLTQWTQIRQPLTGIFSANYTTQSNDYTCRSSRRRSLSSQDNIWTVPNVLSAARIASAPIVGYLVIKEQYLLAMIGTAFASLTDLLDGWIARTWPSQKSTLGSILDPMGDKLLVGTLACTMTMQGLLPISLATLMVVRDLGIVSFSFYIQRLAMNRSRTKANSSPFKMQTVSNQGLLKIQPTSISRWNTTLQMSLLVLSLVQAAMDFSIPFPLMSILQWAVAGTTMASGYSYYRIFRRILHHLQFRR